MSLLEEALAETKKPGGKCAVRAWLSGLTAKEQAEVADAMAEPAIQHTALHRAIKKRWPDAPGVDSVARHRKQECACGAR